VITLGGKHNKELVVGLQNIAFADLAGDNFQDSRSSVMGGTRAPGAQIDDFAADRQQ
jgi:hypothetical protein